MKEPLIAATYTLEYIAYRVPLRGELYIGKDGRVQRLHQDRYFSKRAKKKTIVKEAWIKP